MTFQLFHLDKSNALDLLKAENIHLRAQLTEWRGEAQRLQTKLDKIRALLEPQTSERGACEVQFDTVDCR
jgi:hypothetical protein